MRPTLGSEQSSVVGKAKPISLLTKYTLKDLRQPFTLRLSTDTTALSDLMAGTPISADASRSNGGWIPLQTETKTRLSTETVPSQRLDSQNDGRKNRSQRPLAKLYVAKYEATTLEGADQFLQDLLKLGLSKFTNSDEKEIDQYVREHQSSNTWGIQKDDLP